MDDYIKKAALMSHVENEARRWGDDYDWWQILADIEDFPPADVRPVVRGHWEEYDFMGERAYRCSNCKCMAPASWSLDGSHDLEGQFCNSCGAYMREKSND